MAKTPTWQRAEGKDPEGGLNEKGRASLRAAGHDIKRPQPEGGPRKRSFCARMEGAKSKLTSSETANDPDSRINKSLRKWKCADGGSVDPYDNVQQAARMPRKDGGSNDPYENMQRLIEQEQERQRREKDPMFSIQPEEYHKGNLGLGRYVLATGGRANMALGGDPTAEVDAVNPVLANPSTANQNYIKSLYQNILGRAGEQGGVDYWTNQLNQGNMDQGQMLQQFARSNEFQGLYQQDPSKAVASLYRTALGRDPEQGGLDYWTGQAKGGMGLDAMTQAFLNSQEGQNVSNINQYYQDYTGNVATPQQIQQAMGTIGQNQNWSEFLNKTFPQQPTDDGSYEVAGGWQSKATEVPKSSADLMAKLGPIEQQYGLPQGYLMGMMGIESTYGQNQKTPGSSYSGAFQLSPSLIKQYGVKNPYDWTQSADAAAQYAAANRDYFKKVVGRDPTPQELYGLHQQGNAFAYMAKSPDVNAAQVLRQSAPKTYRTMAAAQNAIRGNLPDDMRGRANTMTAQDFMDFYNNKYNQKLGGPDQIGQQAISSYYQPATVQQAVATTPQPQTAPVDPRVIYNAQMEKYKTDKAEYDNWLANYMAGEAMAGRPIVAPSSGGMKAPVMPTTQNIASILAQQGAGGNIATGTPVATPIASTGSAASNVGYQPPALSWEPQGTSTYSPPVAVPSYYPTPDLNGIGNGWGTNYSGGGGWAGGATGYSAPSFGSSATPANFSGSVSTFSPGGQFADGGTVDPYNDVQKAAKGGAIWDKSRPKKLGKPEPLSSKEKSSAKAMAKAAGRPYPNLIDNMRAARADGGEVEGDVQFAPDDPYAKVQEAAKLPMMAQHEYAMRMPEPEVKYDTGPQPGEATLKAYDPTIKERIYQGIAGTEERPSPERAQFARGMSQMAEFAPVLGNVMAGQEAQRRGDTKGMLMAALPVPGMATEARMAEAAASPVQQAAREAYQRVLNAQGLHSHAAEAAYNLPQAKGSYEQMMAMLQKAGVKPEELRWSGVEQFAGQPVTREQLVSHFEQNVPKIEETVLRKSPPAQHDNSDILSRIESDWVDIGTPNTPKFEQYTIPGGQNYREVLLHTPGQKQDLYKQISQAREDRIAAVREHGSVLKYDDPALEQERLQKIREATKRENDLRNQLENIPPEFTSSHWDQPNVLGHLRLSDRTGPQGEKILHMEELQSDWGQAGRKQGFKNPLTKQEEKELEDLQKLRVQEQSLEQTQRITELSNRKIGKAIPTAPYVESTKNWVDLGLKRALKEAAENGYDKLVWTPGAEQAARYDLSRQIKNLHYVKTDKGYLLGPETHTGQEVPINSGQPIPESKIADYVGKDVAEKIINGGESGVLSGLDLSVGGEGMKSFYDNIIPSRLKELMKKIDPQAKVQLGSHPISKDGEEVRAHSIQITPKMREAILKGLPAYAKGGEVVNNTDPYDNMRLKAKNFPRARRASH